MFQKYSGDQFAFVNTVLFRSDVEWLGVANCMQWLSGTKLQPS